MTYTMASIVILITGICLIWYARSHAAMVREGQEMQRQINEMYLRREVDGLIRKGDEHTETPRANDGCGRVRVRELV